MSCNCASSSEFARQMESYLSVSRKDLKTMTCIEEEPLHMRILHQNAELDDRVPTNISLPSDSDSVQNTATQTTKAPFPSAPTFPSTLFDTSDGGFDFGGTIEEFLGPQELLTPTSDAPRQDRDHVNDFGSFTPQGHEMSEFGSSLSHTAFETAAGMETTHRHTNSSSTNYSIFSGSSAESCSCVNLGLATLRSMYSSSSPHMCIFSQGLDHDSPIPRKMDEALRINGTTVESVSRILDCSSHCVDNSTLQVILLVICDRLINWNQAILGAGNEDPGMSSTTSTIQSPLLDRGVASGHNYFAISSVAGTSNAENDPGRPKERVSREPLCIGSHYLDETATARLVACLVLHELHRLDQLINRFHAARTGGGSRANTVVGMLDLLRRRVLDVKEEASRKATG
ncbi:hypothetical protein GE09DRAFT_730868 [Coniochaeta sp. 2T2.1]|nr:hypothetical protein GE09DRAFT_730868 [Coniochaeta sp. 2T2.1]